jgi:quercetin dioxygenase-like cupin family protein
MPNSRIFRRSFIAGVLGILGIGHAADHPPSVVPTDRSATEKGTTTSSDGTVRTTLEHHTHTAGEEFRMVLTTYPPGGSLLSHHHPAIAFNYIPEGVAESQYEVLGRE